MATTTASGGSVSTNKPIPTTGGHGQVTFWTDTIYGGSQAVSDITKLQQQKQDLALQAGPAGVATVLTALSIGATVASTVATLMSAGVGFAQLMQGSQGQSATAGSLQIDFTNNSSQPLVVYDYNPGGMNIASVCEPMAPGESSMFLVLAPQEGFQPSAQLKLQVLVGPIDVHFWFTYTSAQTPGYWRYKVEVDQTSFEFPPNLGLFGVRFQGATGDDPSFCFYATPIDSPTGNIGVNFYDMGDAYVPSSSGAALA